MKSHVFSKEDKEVVRVQIKREPKGIRDVVRYCPYGFPQVIRNEPLVFEGDSPVVFPTLFWLTCPYLKKQVARVESTGLIQEFQKKLLEDRHFKAALAKVHARYAKERVALVVPSFLERLRNDYPDLYQVLTASGVGGIRECSGIKCLHTHVADYLARGDNLIGEEVFRRVPREACTLAQCEEE